MNISKELAWELQTLLYSRWAKAYDELKAAKAEKNDGSQDWQQFHEHRVHHAVLEERRLMKLRNEYDPIAGRIHGGAR